MEIGNTAKSVVVGRQAWLTLAILSSTLLTVFFSETMLLPALPEIIRDFSISYGTAAWIFSAYLIVAAVMTPVAGRLSDLYGKKKVLLTLLAIYLAGLTAGGFADNISFLLATRIIQGMGLAAVPAAFSLLRDTFPPAKLPLAIGVFGSAYSAGSVVGLLAGASIIQNFGWHATFLAIVPFSALVTLMIAKFVKENNATVAHSSPKASGPSEIVPKAAAIDIRGVLALSATIASFLIALTLIQVGISSANLPQIAAAFVASGVSLAVFVMLERKIVPPFLDLRLLKNKILLPAFLLLISTGITMFMIYPTIVQLVRSPIPLGFGGSAVDAANVQLPFMIAFLIFSAITPFIINRIGSVKPAVIGGIVSLIGAIGLLVFHSTGLETSINLALVASGLSLTMTSTWNVVVSFSPREFMGISTGVGALLLFIGMAIGPALAGVYLENRATVPGVSGLYPSPASYNVVFLTAGLLSAATLVFGSMLIKRASNKVIAA